MWYVERDSDNNIVGVNRHPAIGPGDVVITDPHPLEEDDPEIVAFLTRDENAAQPDAALTPDEKLKAFFASNPDVRAYVFGA